MDLLTIKTGPAAIVGEGMKAWYRLDKKHKKLLCKNSSVFYWDIPNTMYAFNSENPAAGDPTGGYLEMFANQFESMILTADKKVDDSVKSEMSFNFINKGENSLEQFFNFINDIYIELLGGAKT